MSMLLPATFQSATTSIFALPSLPTDTVAAAAPSPEPTVLETVCSTGLGPVLPPHPACARATATAGPARPRSLIGTSMRLSGRPGPGAQQPVRREGLRHPIVDGQ